jgi:hypothetical protein
MLTIYLNKIEQNLFVFHRSYIVQVKDVEHVII